VGPVGLTAGLRVESGVLFLGSSASVQLCWVSVKGCRVWPVMSAYVSCISGLSGRMYIDSNRRDSQI
jgi:hypothetical protein